MSSLNAEPPPKAESRDTMAALRSFTRRTPALQLAVLIVVFIVAAVTISGFVSKPSIYSVLVLSSFLGIAATGQTLVVLVGAIDLSVASLIDASNLAAPVLGAHGWPFGLVIVVVIAAGGCVGAVNGLLVKRLSASPLIVTLATGAVVYGIALATTNSGLDTGVVPLWLEHFSSPTGHTLGVALPPVVVLWALIAIVLGVILRRTVTGRRMYAAGANQRAADLAGVRTNRIWVGAYGLSGAAAAATGVILAGFAGGASAGVGDPYLFTSLAAVVVGGSSLIGARGDYWRTVLGALILTLATTVLVGHGAGESVQEWGYGALILVFVGLYGRERRVRDRV